MSDDSINNHVKDSGRQPSPLSYPTVALEDGPVMPSAFASIWSRTQYVRSMRSVLGPTPYPVRISRQRSLSRALYEFHKSRKMECRTAYLMAMRLCSSFASKAAVPVPLPAQKPCRESWNWMEDNIRQLMMPDIAFHMTSTRPIPPKSVPTPLGIITTVCH